MNYQEKRLTKWQSIGVIATLVAVCMVVVSDVNCQLLEHYRNDYFAVALTNRSKNRSKWSVKKEGELGKITGSLLRLHSMIPHWNCSIH